jgi:YD repeat-containing protein
VRSYNSDPRMGWTHNWARRLDLTGHPFIVWAYRGSTQRIAFNDDGLTGTAYVPVSPWRDRLSVAVDADGTVTGWTLKVFDDDSTERYDATGRLQSVQMRNGWRFTLSYKGGQLDKVTNPFGRSLGFRYNADGRLSRLIDPAGGEIAYGYDNRGNPNRVTWQDKKFRRYHYEDKRFPELLTGITDEADVRVETYSYDDQRRVKETSLAGGVDRLTFEYTGSPNDPYVTTVVTGYNEAGSTSSNYLFVRPAGGLAWAPTSITAPCSLCGNTQANTTYDSAGRVFKAVAHDDTPTFYQYDDANGRETERATFPASFQNASTRPALEEATRVVSTRWHATWNLPRDVAEPNKITEYGYDGKGNLKSESWSATKDDTGAKAFDAVKTGSSYGTESVWNSNNLVKTIREKVDSAEVLVQYITYTDKGDVQTIKDSSGVLLGKATRYDLTGLIRSENDTIGYIDRTYTPRGFIKRQVTENETLDFGYDDVSRLKSIESSNGGKYEFKYSEIGNLEKVYLNGQLILPSPGNSITPSRASDFRSERSSMHSTAGSITVPGGRAGSLPGSRSGRLLLLVQLAKLLQEAVRKCNCLEGYTQIYRVAGSVEYALIQSSRAYSLQDGGYEQKLFWLNPVDADWFAENEINIDPGKKFENRYIVTSQVCKSRLNRGYLGSDVGHTFISFGPDVLPQVNFDADLMGGIQTMRVIPAQPRP